MFNRIAALLALIALSACTEVATTTVPTTPGSAPVATVDELRGPDAAARAFAQVTRRVEPVAEAECRRQTRDVNCDFRIVLDSNPRAPSNAFQTLDDTQRPVIVFTIALLEDARNADELAFVMGHEAAHHIAGHIARQQQNAALGAVLLGGIAANTGFSGTAVQQAAELGAAVGARSYSKEFELEADALGTRIAALSGYDPVRGAQFFNRIPDPGDRFLGTHPPNAQRIETVRRVAAGL